MSVVGFKQVGRKTKKKQESTHGSKIRSQS